MSMSEAAAGRRWSLVLILVGAFVAASGPATAEGDAKWTGDVSLSVTAQSGTTDTFAGAFDANGARDTEKDHVGVRLKADYGTSRNIDDGGTNTTQDSQELTADWKHTVHDRFFWQSGSEVSRDSTQDRKLRAAVDTGPGYRVWRSDDEGKEHFDLMGGVGYRFEVYGLPPAETNQNGNDSAHFADLIAGFEYKNMLFDNKIDYTHTGSVQAPANSFSDFIATTEAIVAVPLSEAWSFRTSFLVAYVNEVPDRVNKVTTKTSIGLGYKF